MGDAGKDRLREQIKNKRAIEGLEDVPPEDLFTKKPKYDISDEEKERVVQRRQKNKEAAEKSRKKKKEEFEKVQMENAQLNQDRCEMAAMVEKLKDEKKKQKKEIRELQYGMEQLKRWIGKHAAMLGIVNPAGKVNKEDDHFLTMMGNGSKCADHQLVVRRPDSTLEGCSPQPLSMEHFKPVSSALQSPWLVEQPALKLEQNVLIKEPVHQPAGPVPSVICLPKDKIIIIQDWQQVSAERFGRAADVPQIRQIADGVSQRQQIADGVSQRQQMVLESPEAESSKDSGNVCSIRSPVHGDVHFDMVTADKASQNATAADNENSGSDSADPRVVTAIESLLRLGYKIESPRSASEESQITVSATQKMTIEAQDKSCQWANIKKLPMSISEFTGLVSINQHNTLDVSTMDKKLAEMRKEEERREMMKEIEEILHSSSSSEILT